MNVMCLSPMSAVDIIWVSHDLSRRVMSAPIYFVVLNLGSGGSTGLRLKQEALQIILDMVSLFL